MQVKLNTDESPTVATEYGIRSIPTVMIFKNGKLGFVISWSDCFVSIYVKSILLVYEVYGL